MQARPEPAWRRVPRLLLLSNLCVGVPVLIYGADRRTYFLSYECDGLDLIVIAGAIAFLPGLVLALAEGLVHRATGCAPHRLVLALLWLGTGHIVAGWGLGLTGARAVAMAVGLAALLFRVTRELPQNRLQAALAVAACLSGPVYVLGFSDLARLLRATPARAYAAAVARPHPVVLLLFDGMPLAPLLDARHELDAAQFPNFARLARRATFYRNASCNFGYTERSVPSLLSGKLPGRQELPVAADHPDTLFTLLGGTYRFHVLEWGTAMFPSTLTPHTRVAPGRLDRYRAIALDLSITLPMVYSAALTDADLAEMVQHLQFFSRQRGKGTDDAFDRVGVFRRWLAQMPRGDPRTLYYAHVGLPHDPWNHLPDGTPFDVPEESSGLRMVMPRKDMIYFLWNRDEWTVHQAYQRLLFQMEFCDRLLGELLDRMSALGIDEDALLIVTTDHGSAVIPGSMPRNILMPAPGSHVPPNHREILPVPLFVKRPGQQAGAVEDRNVELIDVLPTIASELSVRVPWPMDGAPLPGAGAPPVPERPEKVFLDYDLSRFTLPAAFPDRFDGLAKRGWFEGGADWMHRLEPFGDWPGRALPAGEEPEPGLAIALAAGDPPGVLHGRVHANDLPGECHVAVLADRTVVAVTRVQRSSPHDGSFLAFPLPGALRPGATLACRLLRADGRVRAPAP